MFGQVSVAEFCLASLAAALVVLGQMVSGTLGAVLAGTGILVAIFAVCRIVKTVRAEADANRNEFLEKALETGTQGIAVFNRNRELLDCNDQFRRFFDLPEPMTIPGTPLKSILWFQSDRGDYGHDEDPETQVSSRFERITRTDRHPVRVTSGGGRRAYLNGHEDEDGNLVLIYLPDNGLDQAPTDTAAPPDQDMQNRYALAFAGSMDCMWDWDVTNDRFYASERWAEILGIGNSVTDADVQEWFNRVHPSDLDSLNQDVASLKASRGEHMRTEFRLLHSDGDYVWMMARALGVRDNDGQLIRITGSMTDISEWKRSEEKLIKDALYDPVTGLPNRALFLDRIDREIRRSRATGEARYAILVLDLDRFKVVNDSLGHDLGDALLVEVARRLESSAGPGDSIARLSGDEFGILLTDVEDMEKAQDTAHWIQNDLAAAFTIGNQEIFTSGCIGVALPSDGFSTSEEMLRAADIAMYRAKDNGQSSTAIFDRQMQSRAITLLQMENDLRRAVDRDEIEMFYQPIVSLDDGRMKGVEALARWRHPDRGTIVPADFIPLAEDTGLINAIGTAALRLACRQMKAWKADLGERAPERMSVNLSSRQLQDPNLVREIELILSREGVSGSCLKLEVTESMIMMNPEVTSRSLLDLKELGVALSIDDFGTGYSSLSYLHRFPFDTLKIDRSFVVSMEDKVENSEIIRSITLLAHNLGMDIVAEGIETPSHVRHLRALECELGQGFYFASPLPADRISEMIAADRSWEM
ncbi:MAG: EAL domain-containing protein [Alphaproteobacteria bacterium]